MMCVVWEGVDVLMCWREEGTIELQGIKTFRYLSYIKEIKPINTCIKANNSNYECILCLKLFTEPLLTQVIIGQNAQLIENQCQT